MCVVQVEKGAKPRIWARSLCLILQTPLLVGKRSPAKSSLWLLCSPGSRFPPHIKGTTSALIIPPLPCDPNIWGQSLRLSWVFCSSGESSP